MTLEAGKQASGRRKSSYDKVFKKKANYRAT